MTLSNKMNRESGFTLIEIIASLILVGFMSVFAGSVIVTFTKGYLFTKENAHMAQKSQLAISRINRELLELLNVTTASPTAITIESTSGIRTIGLNDGKIKIAESPTPLANGNILIDDVSNFSLSYYAGTQPWAQGNDIRELSAIDIKMILTRLDGGSIDFTTTVHPRNTNNYGGAPPASEPLTKFDYCFLATAAFGNSDHPMVEVLRQFRDRFLITWKGGQSLVNAYYAVGPAFARYIEDHKWIAPYVRLMLLPLAGFAVLMLKNPLSVPLILLISWLITRMMSGLVRLSSSNTFARLFGNKGSVLIGLIITMVVISALGAAMLPLTSTATFGQIRSNSAARAYFLAESGYRYAASEYLNAGSDSAKNNRLLAMHDQTFTLQDDAGKFELVIYPYFFTTTSNPSGTQTLEAAVPGAFPPGLVLSSGKLRIGSQVYDYTSAARIDRNVTFTMSQTMPYVPVDSEIFYVATSADTEVAKGGNLTVQSGTAYAFPLRNGTFIIDKVICSYKQNDLDNDQLTEIDFPNDPDRTSLTGISGADIVLQKFVKLHSTGTFGLGDVAVSRENVYHVPLPSTSSGKKVEFIEKHWGDTGQTNNFAHWEDSSTGSHRVDTPGGDKALKVTGTADIGSGNLKSELAFDWSETDVDLESGYKFGGNMLSYDAQVKIGFDLATPPNTYMAGLSFRLDGLGSTANSYGISLVRGGTSDGIPDEFVPPFTPDGSIPLLVLWQQASSLKKWIAYKELVDPVYFFDDMENGESNWTPENPTPQNPWDHYNPGHNSNTCWTDSPSGDYPNSDFDISLTTSQSIDLSEAVSPLLTFWHYYEIVRFLSRGGYAYVEISTDGGLNWSTLKRYDGLEDSWIYETIDLSFYTGQLDVKIQFRLEFIQRYFFGIPLIPTGDGWYIDDVKIYEKFPINESTLLVRIKEAASIGFNSGGTTAIQDGDLVLQKNGSSVTASATVEGDPILSSGSWAGGDAEGIITLKNVSGTFDTELPLLVNGLAIATYDGSFNAQDNYIRVFYGDTSGYGTSSNNYLDYDKLGNPRGEANWAPDEVGDWSAGTDYFTLVRWDAKNSAVTSADFIPSLDKDGIIQIPNAIIRSNESDLLSPSSGSFEKPELGLHTFGNTSNQVYFDDFAVQTEVVSVTRVAPIQE